MSRIHKSLVFLVVATTIQVAPAVSFAQRSPAANSAPVSTLADAVRKAVNHNPEVQARFNAYVAASEEKNVAKGGYLPDINLGADITHDWLKAPYDKYHAKNGGYKDKQNWTHEGAAISLDQLIYDGFYTSSQVRRFGYLRLVRYYELLDALEANAADVVRAYADVERHRKNVEHAKANLASHQTVSSQINARTGQGVGRAVDSDSASGRLALAESNLLTEVQNLHDVTARYQRLVGELPPNNLPPVGTALSGLQVPKNVNAALATAYNNNPGFNAAIEYVSATEANRDAARANYHPKLILHAEAGVNHNQDSKVNDWGKGNGREASVGLRLGWNLFRGGADRARVRQAGAEINQAKDLREKACRDLRQNLSIAFNDQRKLQEQLGYLDAHQLATAKARQAYQRQYEIGVRSLLDLLDNENEYFRARIAYTDATYDLLIAQARTLYTTGTLLQALGIQREGLPTAKDAGQKRDTSKQIEVCPIETVPNYVIEKNNA